MWLQKLVSITTFFSACEFHTNGPKNIECNMYCLDCCEDHQALCPTCVSSDHKDHQVIQVCLIWLIINNNIYKWLISQKSILFVIHTYYYILSNFFLFNYSDGKFESWYVQLEMQIRRSSYNEVVRATDIVKRVNILGINPYVINNSRVIFLNKRIRSQPTRKNAGKCYKGSSRCWTCKRNLADPFVFCSLACKVYFVSLIYLFIPPFFLSLVFILYNS